ncbi:MAG: hypothetical protein AB7K41_04890 [Bdellovibrionales bacterium]
MRNLKMVLLVSLISTFSALNAKAEPVNEMTRGFNSKYTFRISSNSLGRYLIANLSGIVATQIFETFYAKESSVDDNSGTHFFLTLPDSSKIACSRYKNGNSVCALYLSLLEEPAGDNRSFRYKFSKSESISVSKTLRGNVIQGPVQDYEFFPAAKSLNEYLSLNCSLIDDCFIDVTNN